MNTGKDRDVMELSGELSRDLRRKVRRKLKADLIKLQGLLSKIEARAMQLLQSRPAPPKPGFTYGHFSKVEAPARNGGGGCSEVIPQSNFGRSVPQMTKQPPFAASNDASSPLGMEVRTPRQAPKTSQVHNKSELLVGKDRPPPLKLNSKLVKNNGQGAKMDKGGEPKHKSSYMSNEVKSYCRNILKKLVGHEDGWIFNEPVDAVKLGLSDYHAVIKKPMDLRTIKDKLEKKRYASPFEFADDVRLTFSNAMSFNPPGNDVHQSAKVMLAMFQKDWDVLREKLERTEGGGEVVGTKSVGQLPKVARASINGKAALPNHSALSSKKRGREDAGSVPAKKSKPSPKHPKGHLANTPLAEPKLLLKHDTQGKAKDWDRSQAPIKPKAKAKSEAFVKPKLLGKPKATTNAKADVVARPKAPPKTNKPAKKSSITKKVMSYEDKLRLQTVLGQLPQRILEELILVMKERDDIDMNQDGDEIEVDLDSFDDDTLWELNRRADEHLNNDHKESESSKREDHVERNSKKHKVTGFSVPVPDMEEHVNSGNKSSSDSGSSSDSDSRSSSTSDSDG